MLTEALQELVREAGGEALLLDARKQRALVSDVGALPTILKNLRNSGFTRMIDFTAQHTGTDARPTNTEARSANTAVGAGLSPAQGGSETRPYAGSVHEFTFHEFAFFLTLRHPGHGHAGLTVKWKWRTRKKNENAAPDAGDEYTEGNQGLRRLQHPSILQGWAALEP